ncbi:hypothetical protein [Paucibacter soli]|uniref:hypothetical protein n=1 Tax=Paucibacter soli TaxID=3133433 RepID=UPI0030B49803
MVRTLFLCLACIALIQPLRAQTTGLAKDAPSFVFGLSSPPDSPLGQWQRRVYSEALRRLGLRLVVAEVPLARLSMLASQGGIDGDIARAAPYAAEHPDMVRVEMSIITAVFNVYSGRPMPDINRLEQLRDSALVAAYHRGVVGCEKTLKELLPPARLNGVSKTAQALRMLERGHVQLFCEVNTEMINEPLAQDMLDGGRLHKLFSIGAPMPLHAYLQRRHAELAVKLANTLRQMKDEGLLDRYWSAGQ